MMNLQQQQSTLLGTGVVGGPSMIPGISGNSLTPLAYAPPGGALTKQQREIYVGNLPPGVSIPQITDFVNYALRKLGVNTSSPVGAVVNAWVSGDGHYAFVEMRTIEEASTAMAYLSGLQIGLYTLKVGRPKASGPSGTAGI